MMYLQTQGGNPSKPKIVAFLYQHDETEVMDIVRDSLAEYGRTVLANIHDAIVVKQRLSVDLKHEIELRMREQTNNSYWSLGEKRLHRWDASAQEAKAQEVAHQRRIAEEEALAAGYKNQWMENFTDDDYEQ